MSMYAFLSMVMALFIIFLTPYWIYYYYKNSSSQVRLQKRLQTLYHNKLSPTANVAVSEGTKSFISANKIIPLSLLIFVLLTPPLLMLLWMDGLPFAIVMSLLYLSVVILIVYLVFELKKMRRQKLLWLNYLI